jgi:aminopeptidase N
VALNIAPYRTIQTRFASVAGDTFPVVFYVLPESYDNGTALFPEILEQLSWFERTLGPYPFRADKYGVAQTPHLGMEHQTIIAYGANFDNGAMTGGVDLGFDALHQHELSHEWWGNLVTNADWKDMWIHEGFGTYMQALYVEDTRGRDAYRAYMRGIRPRLANRRPVAPRHSLTAGQVYGGDIYFKGAWILHTLRYLIGDDAFRRSLRRMAYPDSALAKVTDGTQVRFAGTTDFVTIAEQASGRELDWFFDVYVRRAELPRLLTDVEMAPEGGGVLTLRWEAPGGLPFPMPVDVRIGNQTMRVEISSATTEIRLPQGIEPVVDPEGWVLKEPADPRGGS